MEAVTPFPGYHQEADGHWYEDEAGNPRDTKVPHGEKESSFDRLAPITAREMLERARARGPRRWAIEQHLPERTQSANAAPRKSTKSWEVVDSGISLATGTPYLNTFKAEIQPVVIYASEFDEATMRVRLEAVCRAKGLDPDKDLDFLHIAFVPPRLLRPDDIEAVVRHCKARDARLCYLDPLYKSAAGLQLNDLVSVGSAVSELGSALAAESCGLRVIHHSKKGEASGLDRFSGVGIVEWARVVSTMRLDGAPRDAADGFQERDVILEVEGSEIRARSFRVTVRLRSSGTELDDPVDYEVSAVDLGDLSPAERMPAGRRRIVTALTTEWQTTSAIQEATANDGSSRPLRNDTVSKYLRELEVSGEAEGSEGGFGRVRLWRLKERS